MRDRWFDRETREFVTLELNSLPGGAVDAMMVTFATDKAGPLTGMCIGNDCGKAIKAMKNRNVDDFENIDVVWLGYGKMPDFRSASVAQGDPSLRSKLAALSAQTITAT